MDFFSDKQARRTTEKLRQWAQTPGGKAVLGAWGVAALVRLTVPDEENQLPPEQPPSEQPPSNKND